MSRILGRSRSNKSGAAGTSAASSATSRARLPFGETGGAVALAFIGEQLDAEQTRRQSFEQRGLALVASAGGLVTILFGLLAIASRTDQRVVTVPHSARVLVVVALPFLFAAALAGIDWTFERWIGFLLRPGYADDALVEQLGDGTYRITPKGVWFLSYIETNNYPPKIF